ncbi:MAG: RNA polymerase subunit sigma [Novosphingobium sp. 12-64-8]|nr:MAG: RNA polymerase subunit sigma [Novosphingobium sp. 12-64-8]
MDGSKTDTGALRAAIVAVLPRLRRFCQARAGNADDGDDLMQATVERALLRSHQFDPATRLDSWMFRIAQNIHIDQIRGVRRRGAHVSDEELIELPGDDGRILVENRSDLALVLVVIEGQGYRQAADTLGIPVGTVMSRLARARARIAEAMAKGAPVS